MLRSRELRAKYGARAEARAVEEGVFADAPSPEGIPVSSGVDGAETMAREEGKDGGELEELSSSEEEGVPKASRRIGGSGLFSTRFDEVEDVVPADVIEECIDVEAAKEVSRRALAEVRDFDEEIEKILKAEGVLEDGQRRQIRPLEVQSAEARAKDQSVPQVVLSNRCRRKRVQ